eukprot:TRINITY_DN4287_c0_g1_i6.p1 TRINITY_DN4287_c0_g1~~TRINITY_DN4287_c0_g1_i6.p1  ORF type:complete len:139 (-),score=8.11 TRINITY_DN4287_c0_g1_i6:252-668(-)
MIRRPPRSTLSSSSAASDVYKRQYQRRVRGPLLENHAPETTAVVLRACLVDPRFTFRSVADEIGPSLPFTKVGLAPTLKGGVGPMNGPPLSTDAAHHCGHEVSHLLRKLALFISHHTKPAFARTHLAFLFGDLGEPGT